MLRGTRIITGEDARLYNQLIQNFRESMIDDGFEEIIVPAIWERDTFYDKVGPENQKMMWTFQDKGERDVCLIPEVTGLIQEMWREEWSKRRKSWNIFYITRCYRYERPQEGRYREFTQMGIEMLGDETKDANIIMAKWLLKKQLGKYSFGALRDYQFEDNVKRGLGYYTEDGFEANVPFLGAQKQIAGGGAYPEGIGWAIGLDRLLLAIRKHQSFDALD